jgi:hypothetical protein
MRLDKFMATYEHKRSFGALDAVQHQAILLYKNDNNLLKK